MSAAKRLEDLIKRPWCSEEDERLRAVWTSKSHYLRVTMLEQEVFGDICVYCGDPADSLDHVVPLARGGVHCVENLVPACLPCNKSKKDKLLTEWEGPTHKEKF